MLLEASTLKDVEQLAREVKEVAATKGLSSTRQIGGAADIDHTILQNLFAYNRRPSVVSIIKLAQAFNADQNRWLDLAGWEPMPEGSAQSKPGSVIERVEIAMNGDPCLSEFTRKRVIELLEKDLAKARQKAEKGEK